MLVFAVGSALLPASATPNGEVLTGRFHCGKQGVAMGLPPGVFTVAYYGLGEQEKAVLPLHGKKIVFAIGMSADGSRYVRGRYTWWDAATPSFTIGDRPHDKTIYCKHAD